MSSSGRSKAPRGGKEDHIDDRTSGATEEPIGKKSEFVSRREFIERMDYESAKNEERFLRWVARMDLLAESTDRKFDEIMELMRTLLVRSPFSNKDLPPELESTPSPVVLDTKASNSVNLSAHMDEDNSSAKQAEEKKEEKPVVVATVHFSAACTVPKQRIDVKAFDVSKLEPIELIVEHRTLSILDDNLNFELCAVLDTITAVFQAWPEFSFSDGFPPGPPKKPPPWFEKFTTSIVVVGQL